MIKLRSILLVWILITSLHILSAQDTNYTISQQLGGRGRIYDVKWSPQDDALAVASDQGVWLYTPDLEDIRLLPTAEQLEGVTGIVWSADGKRIFAENMTPGFMGRKNNVIYAWDVATGAVIFSERLEDNRVVDAIWELQGQQLLILLQQNTTITLSTIDDISGIQTLYQFDDGQKLRDLQWNADGTLSVTEIIPDGTTVFTFNTTTGDILDTTSITKPSGVFSPDGSVIAVTTRKTLEIQDTVTGETLHTFEFGDEIRVIAWGDIVWTQDSSQIISYLVRPARVVVFDILNSKITYELQFPPDTVITSMDVYQPSNKLAISFMPGILEVYDLDTGERLEQRWADIGVGLDLSWSPDSQMLATVNGDSFVRIWDTTSGREISTLQHEVGAVFSVAWTSDGSKIAAGNIMIDDDNMPLVMVWDMPSGAVIETLPVLDSVISDVVIGLDWSADNRTLFATRPSNQTGMTALRAWDSDTGEVLFTQEGFFLFDTDINPTTNLLATVAFNSFRRGASEKDTLQIWGMPDVLVAEIDLPDNLKSSGRLKWHPTEQLIAIASNKPPTLYFWDILNNTLDDSILLDGIERIIDIDWHPDGEYLAILGENENYGVVQIWAIDVDMQGRLLQTIDVDRLMLSPTSIVWSPDGQQLAVGTSDGAIMILAEK